MLSPEINSARMYVGPGSAPMLAAAAAWDELAAALQSTAAAYSSVVSGVTAGPWLGPSSVSMAAAAAPYVAWMSTTAAQAEETATQAKAAAAAYTAAFAATVPPAVITANRSELMALLRSNLLGQNAPAIATTEAQYADMWAQDAAAMYGYAGSSASATSLTPFSPPQQNTNPVGPAGQAAAAGQATGTPAGNVQSAVSSSQQAFSAVPNTLQGLAAPAQALSPLDTLNVVADLITIFLDTPANVATLLIDAPLAPLAAVSLPMDILSAGTGLHTDNIVSGWDGKEAWPSSGTRPPTEFPAKITGPIGSSAPATTGAVSAGLGEANTVGTLSVPPTWTIATPAVRPLAVMLPALPVSATAAEAAGNAAQVGSGSMFGQMATAGMAGRAMAGTLGTEISKDQARGTAGTRVRAGTGGTAMTADGAAPEARGDASPETPRTVVTGVAAELREFAKLRDEGILTEEEYTEQKNRLLGR